MADIASLYKSTLGRDPDEAGLKYWSSYSGGDLESAFKAAAQAELGKAPTTSNVTSLGLFSNPVYTNGVYDYNANMRADNNAGLTYGAMTNDRDYQINSAYQAVLGRNADQAGMEYYLKSGKSAIDIERELRNSPEYMSYNPGANPNQTGVHFNQAGVRNDPSYQGMINSSAVRLGMTPKEYNEWINPFTYDTQQYDSKGRLVLGSNNKQWDSKSNVPVTLAPEGARNLYEATMVSGMPTSVVDSMGGYNAIYSAAQKSPNFVSGTPSNLNVLRFGNSDWLKTIGLEGNKQYTEGNKYFNQALQDPAGRMQFDANGDVIGAAGKTSTYNPYAMWGGQDPTKVSAFTGAVPASLAGQDVKRYASNTPASAMSANNNMLSLGMQRGLNTARRSAA